MVAAKNGAQFGSPAASPRRLCRQVVPSPSPSTPRASAPSIPDRSALDAFPDSTPAKSALDAIPDSLKLNAVAESLARSRDIVSALAVAEELRKIGESLQPRARAAIVDAIAASPGTEGARSLGRLFETAPPRGYGGALSNKPALSGEEAQTGLDGDSNASGELPDAGRRGEVALATVFLSVVGVSVGAEVVEPFVLHHAANEATSVLMMLVGGFAFDKFSSDGMLWNKVSNGMDRLLLDDPAREAHVEAAYFLTAYLLGLPWAPFRPDVNRLLKLHGVRKSPSKRRKPGRRKRSTRKRQSRGEPTVSSPGPVATVGRSSGASVPALDDVTVDRYLIWLLAGVAAEARLDGQLLESDTVWARNLLRATNTRVDKRRIIKAYRRAKELLERHQVLHADLSEKMLEGLSAGECVILLEKSLARFSA